jgi:superfamily I DNA and/or RNA helicase
MLCAINRHCETLIMVGDHKQLPPTLKSDIVYTLGHSGGGSSKLNQVSSAIRWC